MIPQAKGARGSFGTLEFLVGIPSKKFSPENLTCANTGTRVPEYPGCTCIKYPGTCVLGYPGTRVPVTRPPGR
eukprot:1789100-Rhodomonas_salina.1